MKHDNLPALCVRLVVVQRRNDRRATCRIQIQGADGEYVGQLATEWATGRPTPSELDALVAALTDIATTQIVTRIGVQGVL